MPSKLQNIAAENPRACDTAGQKVSFQSIDCLADYSKITHVYFCDTAGCG